jgi:hypothetical protein
VEIFLQRAVKMTEQCFGRITRDGESHRGRFPDNHRFSLEYRCPNQIKDDQLCSRCLEWKARGVNKKDPYRCHHGFIFETIPEWSHIYEGPWYLSKVTTYGEPSESEMARAKKAQVEARKEVEMNEEVKEVKEEPKKKRAYKRKEKPAPAPVVKAEPAPVVEAAPEPAPVVELAPVPKPVAKPTTIKKRRAKKEVTKVPEQPNVQIQAVEAATPALTDIEVVKIIVRPFSVNNTSYFLDGKKNKLYSVGKDKRPSSYVGRWNPESQTIDTDFPDSDAE